MGMHVVLHSSHVIAAHTYHNTYGGNFNINFGRQLLILCYDESYSYYRESEWMELVLVMDPFPVGVKSEH